MTVCPACGADNREGARFCDACGSSLEAPEPGGSRRTVTVLFSDITGSTELSHRLDPELFSEILGRYFDSVRTVIERHGGTVEKFIGDAVMAVFGVPHIHEDDALRAVRAAGEIADALSALNDELAGMQGVRIQTRTGVNTGEVMVGDPSTGDTLVTGVAANVAARLEQVAQPGDVLIGPETHRLVRDAVLAEPLEPLTLKGVPEPVIAFRVRKVDPGATGFARRLDAPMVGRGRELALLRDAFDRAISDDACQLFTVLGIGGVGKSRLLSAFLDGLPEGVMALRGRCLPYGDGISFWPVIEAVGQAAGLTGGERSDEALAKISALISDDEHADRIARQLAQILGLAGGEAAPEETLWAIRRFLEGVARRQPVAFVIDDVQRAEPTMLDLIEYLADWVVDTPLLIACMARPELLEARPAWGGGKLNATSINLEPLSVSECGTLVSNLLAIDTVDPIVRERVAAAAEGHPLFAEEMLAMLVDDGRVVREGSEWVAVGDLRDLSVPPTTSALLAARIDRLGRGERATLERASVMGQVFYREALDELAEEDVSADVASLVRKQFVRPERSDVPGMDAMAFRHLMIRDAAYEGMPKSLRGELHERFSDWLEARASEQEELIGYHLEQAQSYLVEVGGDAEHRQGLAQRAAGHLRAAGRRAYERNDVPASVGLLSRASTLMSADDPETARTLIDFGIAVTEAGELDRGVDALERAISIAEAAGDELLSARAGIVRIHLSFWGKGMGIGWQDLTEQVRSTLPVFEAAGDDLGAGWAWCVLGSLSWGRSRAAETETAWRRAVDLFRRAGDRHMMGEYLSWLASPATWGTMSAPDGLRELDRLLLEAKGSLAVEAEITSDRSTLLWMVGEFDEARRVANEGHQKRLELGRRVADAHASQNLGWLELMAGNAAEAERVLGNGARDLHELGSEQAGRILSSMHAHALYALGRYDEAGRAAADGWDPQAQDFASNAICASARAMVAARRGAFEDAEKMSRHAIAMIDQGDFINDQADARMALAEVLQLAGRAPEAAEVVQEALDRYRTKGNVTQSAIAEVRLAELRT
ncbi:MAG TPA: adenylate/guanylate cyclase domain-containing protein [Actinomycetota bacterium]|nr:adenylate/guanylate cyclase domain-containing protein [Actinomycetota bacterium]